jgi:hypothetical protein
LLVYGSTVVKMDNFHIFEVVLNFLFHTWEVMDNEIYKQHCFFFYMYVCVDLIVHFIVDLVTMIHHNKYICLQTVQFFHFCALHT